MMHEMRRFFLVDFSCLVLALTLAVGDGDRSRSLLSSVAELTARSLIKLDELWTRLDDAERESRSGTDLILLQSFREICEGLRQVEIALNITDRTTFSSDWSNAVIDAEINNVNAYYETFLRFQKQNSGENRKPALAWSDLAETYLQNSEYGVKKSLDKIHMHAGTELDSENVFKSKLKEMEADPCYSKRSPHQAMYDRYNAVALTELKGNIVIQFGYMILKLYGKGDFTEEAKSAQNKYKTAVKLEREIVKNVLEGADRTVYRCDPKQYVEGVNYEKLTRLLQGYIENEVNLNPYGTCSENCDAYQVATYNGCYMQQFCAHQPACLGKILECRFVDSDMDVCVSSNPERRYDWVEYENRRVLGNKGVCEYKNFYKVDSWWRYLFWHCSYCLCLCDDNVESDRYFNLRSVVSDLQENKVVTGVKLVKHNQVIHIQIQEGVLGARGVIENGTISWKPIDNYTVDDSNVENNVDYHTLSWLERSVDTDDVFGPHEHVVTGVRFRKLGSHLNLEIRITPIEFTTGKVYGEERSYWKGNDNTDGNLYNPRSEIILQDPDVPIRKAIHNLDSKHDQYIQFQASSFETDAGQSTVPFIDSQPLTSYGFPLSGLGLIHRGRPGSGGFIAPKLITYDFSPYIRAEDD